jgi:hypothetical protein
MTEFERGRLRGIAQATALVDHHFGGPPTSPAMQPLINELTGLRHLRTPPEQTAEEAEVQDRTL